MAIFLGIVLIVLIPTWFVAQRVKAPGRDHAGLRAGVVWSVGLAVAMGCSVLLIMAVSALEGGKPMLHVGWYLVAVAVLVAPVINGRKSDKQSE